MIQTVIFDMDGVIVDTEPVHRYAYFKLYEELGIEVSEEIYTCAKEAAEHPAICPLVHAHCRL